MADDGFVPMADTMLVRVDGDVVRVRNHRLLTMRDLEALYEIYAQIRSKHPFLFVLFDCTHAQGVERDARRAMMQEVPPVKPPDLTAIVGAPFAIRTLSNMIERARVALGRDSMGMRFFESEAQVFGHIDELRRRLQSKR